MVKRQSRNMNPGIVEQDLLLTTILTYLHLKSKMTPLKKPSKKLILS